jgi:RNA polymerase sigma factor (sigma-70 family)
MADATEDPLRDAAPSGEETRELARSARRGEEGSFAELYERIAPALYAWACLRIRPAMRGHVDPEDVVQEVWCRAWRGLAEFDPESSNFRLWVFRIAKNVLLEAFRKAQRVASGPGAPGPSTKLIQLRDVPDRATAVSRRIARHEGMQAVLKWASDLGEEEQKLFLHCGLEGMPYAEVAERMQLEYDAVAKRWQKLRERAAAFAVPRDLWSV